MGWLPENTIFTVLYENQIDIEVIFEWIITHVYKKKEKICLKLDND